MSFETAKPGVSRGTEEGRPLLAPRTYHADRDEPNRDEYVRTHPADRVEDERLSAFDPSARELRRLARHAHTMHAGGWSSGVPDELNTRGPAQEPDDDRYDEVYR